MKELSHSQSSFFFASSLLMFAVLTGSLFYPFLAPLFLAAALAVAFHPLYQLILKRIVHSPSLASLITVIIILFVFIAPISWLGSQVWQQSQDFYRSYDLTNQTPVTASLNHIESAIQAWIPNFSLNLDSLRQRVYLWLGENLDNVFAGILGTTFHLLIMIVGLYYLLKDGQKLRQAVATFSPLPEAQTEKLTTSLKRTLEAVMRGSLLVAIFQGILIGVGLWLFGVPRAILWGSVGAITALIPGIGTAFVTIPAIAYLVITKASIFMIIGLILWSVLIVGLSDNILRPFLLNRSISLHPFLLLISVLGGLIVIGPIGFIAGPVILSVFTSLATMYAQK